jgi:hypothetical protein
MTIESVSWDVFLVIISIALGFVVSEWSAKSGFDRWMRPRVIVYSGVARDCYVPTVTHLGSPLDQSLLSELSKDFKREKDFDYIIHTVEIRYFRKLITCRGIVTLAEPNRTELRFTFEGKGGYFMGDKDRGAFWAALNCRGHQVVWKLICLVRYAEPTRVQGFWFADDGTAPGRFTVGVIQLTANTG